MKHISLKKLIVYRSRFFSKISFLTYSGAMDCLRNLSEFKCVSDIDSKFFYQLSSICHNLRSLQIIFNNIISDGLANLISTQQNLKWLDIFNYPYSYDDLVKITPSITKFSNSLTKLFIHRRK